MALVVPVSGCTSVSGVNGGQNSPTGSVPVVSPSANAVNPGNSVPSGIPTDDPALTESVYLDELLQQGFTSKDFWQIRFEHLYITFDGKGRTIDLSDGDEPLSAILSQWQGNEANIKGASDQTSQLSGRIMKATSGPSQGYGIYFQGKAYRENSQVAFTIKFEQEFLVKCPFQSNSQSTSQNTSKSKTDVALSLRLENLFGDARLPADGRVNRVALGFDAFAELAEKDSLVIDMATLKQRLAPEAFNTLEKQLG